MMDERLVEDLKRVRSSYDRIIQPLLSSYRSSIIGTLNQIVNELIRNPEVVRVQGIEVVTRTSILEEQRKKTLDLYRKVNLESFFVELDEAVGLVQHDLPADSAYIQQRCCFDAMPGDSPYIRSGKFLKRTERARRKRIRSFFNAFRKLIKKSIIEPEPFVHQVKWIRVTRALTCVLLQEYRSSLNKDLEFYSRYVHLLNRYNDALATDQGQSEIIESVVSELRDFGKELNEYHAKIDQITTDLLEKSWGEIEHVIPYSGTFQQSKKHFSVKELTRIDQKSRNDLRTVIESRATDLTARCDQLSVDIGVLRFNLLVISELHTYVEHLKKVLGVDLVEITKAVSQYLRATADKNLAKTDVDAAKSTHATMVKRLKEEIEPFLQKRLIDAFESSLHELDLSSELEATISSILIADENLPSEVLIFEKSSNDFEKPNTRVSKMNFRSELITYIKNDMLRNIRNMLPLTIRPIQTIESSLSDIMQLVQVNMNVALDMIEVGEESPLHVFELIHDALDRAAKRSDELGSQCLSLTATIETKVEQAVDTYLATTTRIVLDDQYNYLRTKNKEAFVKSKAQDWKTRFIAKWSTIIDSAWVRIRIATRTFQALLIRAKNILGFRIASESGGPVNPEASVFLAETEKKLSELPLIYRKLFSSEALSEPRFFKGRSTVLSLMKSSYESWQSGHFSNFLLIGEKGSGKTSCLQVLPEKIGISHEVVRGSVDVTTWSEKELVNRLCSILDLKPVDDRDAFVQEINSLKDRKVVIFEGFQNMYLRYINGFEALEAFLMILSRTGQKLFWIVTSSRYGWDYLNRTWNTEGFFTHYRSIDNLMADSIEEMILARHKVSGFDVRFIPSESLMSSRSFKKLVNEPDRQALAKTIYFKGLAEIANGNISIAMQYWLRSIVNTTVDSIEIMPFNQVNVRLGDGFLHEDLFTMAALLQHDDLTVDQLALVLNISEVQSRLILSKLTSRAILVQKDHRFYLNQLLYRHVVNMLKDKNIIH